MFEILGTIHMPSRSHSRLPQAPFKVEQEL
jgi:hypothetical protein